MQGQRVHRAAGCAGYIPPAMFRRGGGRLDFWVDGLGPRPRSMNAGNWWFGKSKWVARDDVLYLRCEP